MFGLIILVITIMILGYFVSKIPVVGIPLTILGSIILFSIGGWIGGLIWGYWAVKETFTEG